MSFVGTSIEIQGPPESRMAVCIYDDCTGTGLPEEICPDLFKLTIEGHDALVGLNGKPAILGLFGLRVVPVELQNQVLEIVEELTTRDVDVFLFE